MSRPFNTVAYDLHVAQVNSAVETGIPVSLHVVRSPYYEDLQFTRREAVLAVQGILSARVSRLAAHVDSIGHDAPGYDAAFDAMLRANRESIRHTAVMREVCRG